MKVSQKTYEQAVEKLASYLAAQKMRFTIERRWILEKICGLQQPFNPEQIVDACKEKRLSRATVYNTIEVLCAAHVLSPLKRLKGMQSTEYELVARPVTKMQIICKHCGRINEFRDMSITTLVKRRKYSNFEVQHFTLLVYGECKACRTSRKTTKNKQ